MSISPDALPRMDPQAYLAFERDQPTRHELVDGYLYAMTGATDRHEEIALNLAAALSLALRGSPCRTYKGDLKIRVADDFYYPDVFVRCGAERGDPYFKTDPVVIAEVLSPGTQRYDRGDKPLAYFSLPTLREYVLIAQDRVQVEIYRRGHEVPERLGKGEDILRLDSLGFALSVEALYA
ncbi:MAG: Uma2 family endonuclease [Chromatiaceae bacterium]|jgi:Uma2 family endonuclease|nr:Uma2 family endonuclease [Chromatiaceae bacterium]